MAGDEKKIISLEERRRRREGEQENSEPPSGTEAGTPPQPEEAPQEPLPGTLTWLHCPECETLEYTEEYIPGGRIHNQCGTRVQEVVLDVDVRAEFTIAEFNLARLRLLATWIEERRRHYEELEERLARLAGGRPLTYALSEETLRQLPVAEVDALGLLVSQAFHDPARFFRRDAPEPAGDEPGGPAPDEASRPPDSDPDQG